jgi:hypothetical protein
VIVHVIQCRGPICNVRHHYTTLYIIILQARNFKIAFEAAESEDIPTLLDIDDMVSLPIPDWMSVMTYVSFIYKRFGANAASANGTTKQFLL